MAEHPSAPAVTPTRGRAGGPQWLAPQDAAFLALETSETPLVTGGLGVFEPGLDFTTLLEALRTRLDRVPLARKRIQHVPFGRRPAWVDDGEFDLSFHLRHAALPPPGDARQLGELLSRILSRPLDRARPLWELYLIEGLEGGRTGLLRKVHLAVAGSASADLFSCLLDDEADPAATEQRPGGRWQPQHPAPSSALALEALRERVQTVVDAGNALRHLAAAPGRLAGAMTGAVGTVAGVAARLARGAPESPLNARLTPHRRYVMVRADLEQLREIRRAFGGAVHDAVVAVAGDAVGRLLRSRGHETKDLDLRVMVPVRVEPGAEAAAGLEVDILRHGVVGVLAPLPVMQLDPVARLYRVMGELAAIRESRQAVAAHDLVRLAGYAPPNLHALAARLASAEQRYNLALSNAPGPQEPRYLRGVRMVESYPYIPLAGDAALSIAVSSYAGGMFFGLLGDRAAMADLDDLARHVGEAIGDLHAAAVAARRKGAGR